MILFFRGKAATGKTTVARLVSSQKDYKVISKDSVFDNLLESGFEWDLATTMAYDKLAQTIQDSYAKNLDIIVDIGLAHTPDFTMFLGKMNLNLQTVRMFLFTCSNDAIWAERIARRVCLPDASNQAFTSVQEAKEHYAACQIYPLENEMEMDSALDKEILMDLICAVIE